MISKTLHIDGIDRRVSLFAFLLSSIFIFIICANWMGLCPFHGEKSPSFTVNPTRGMVHCFGCGEHGSAIDFVMKTERLEFIDALKLVVRLVNIGDAKTLACLKWTPCPGQYCPEFKRVRLLPLQRFGAAPR
jgi:hypothetical protein